MSKSAELDGWLIGIQSCGAPGRISLLEKAKRKDERLYNKLVKELKLDPNTIEALIKP